jgi:L-rhamnose-H+ transport protein
MDGQIGLGIAVVILAGVLNGSFAAPMKKMPGWRWENSWLIFALTGLVIFPWLIAYVTIPQLASVYSSASWPTIEKVILFGLMWGIGATLFGLGISRVGLALGFAVILGITASFGSLIPLVVLHPQELQSKRGIALIIGTVIMTIGLACLTIAGRQRERNSGQSSTPRSGFTLGLIICIFSGLFSSMLNFAFVFGDELRVKALAAGASASMAANPIWSLGVSAGFIANAVYCVYLLNKNMTWSVYRTGGSAAYWILGSLMGLLWFGGTLTYGSGAAILGALGGIIGWPVFMLMDIIVGLFWGMITGEWKAAGRKALTYCWVGIGILFLAIIVISLGSAS